jgi:hypothetical protein
VNATVLDPGPIALSAIERFDDPDLDGALRQEGVDPANAAFRLLEIPLIALYDVDWFPGTTKWGTWMIDALDAGKSFPPVVVMAAPRSGGRMGLLDGLNRTHAHWVLGRKNIRAYELLGHER